MHSKALNARGVIGIGIALLLLFVPVIAAAQTSGSAAAGAGVQDDFLAQFHLSQYLEPLYAEVLPVWEQSGLLPVSDVLVEIAGGDFITHEGNTEPVVVSEFEGRTGKILLWQEEEDTYHWQVEVPETGLYWIGIEYYPLPGKRASAMRDVRINGVYPFSEARRLSFERTWRDSGPPGRDNQGNDVRPRQIEVPQWNFKYFEDPEGLQIDPFYFPLEAGVNTITIHSIREPIALRRIVVRSAERLPTYAEVARMYAEKGYQEVKDVAIKIDAERPILKSDPTIRAEFGFDPLSDPPSDGYWRLNEFGGWRWRKGGQWATWSFTVPKSGLYKIGIKSIQNWRHVPSTRKVLIDGVVPFEEMKKVTFKYDRYWGIRTLADDEGNPYLFYLEEGEHTITLEVKVGDNAETIRVLDLTTRELAGIGRAITYITGPNPDPYMEWEVHKRIPGLLPKLEEIRTRLLNEADRIRGYAGKDVDIAEVFELTAHQIKTMIDDPYKIHTRINEFGEMQSRLGTYVLDMRYSPLLMDYLYVAAPDQPFPKAKASLWQRIVYQVRGFLESFTKDYTGVGNRYDKEDALDLWVAWGREWAMAIKEMIEEDFTPNTGIRVNVNLVPAGSLNAHGNSVILLAAASGHAPDIVFGAQQSLPVEFAIRGAVVDLTQFPDFEEVTTRFRPGMLIPYTFRGGVYALPETQSFNMMFYRIDIIEQQLGLKPPETWQDVIEMLPELQQMGMNFFYPSPAGGSDLSLGPFLYQYGSDFYTPDGLRSMLDTPESLQAFRFWTDLWAQYKLPLEANFYNRMRTGELPIGIADYYTYVQLSTAAPELTGWWRMVPIPGIRKENGEIDRSAGGRSTAVTIFADSKRKEEAWELMKWWTSTEVQTRFAEEIEALIGVEAKWNTANIEAFNNLPWPASDLAAIQEQWRWFREKPVVLGDYFTPRHVVNAWNRVVLEGMNPREALERAVEDINRELIRKQEEFGIEIPEDMKRALFRGVDTSGIRGTLGGSR